MNNVEFHGFDCKVVKNQYGNLRPAIALVDSEDGSPVATASVNLVNEPIEDGFVAIKNYSENAGMLLALMEAGIVDIPVRYVTNGFVLFPICKLLI